MVQTCLNVLLAVLLACGILVSQVYVVGFEYHRFFTPSWFFLAAAILLLFVRLPVVNKGGFWMYLMLCALTLYLGLRGIFSELPFMSGKDFTVYFYGLVTFLGVSSLAKRPKILTSLLVFCFGLYLYQITLSFIPKESAGAWPKAWGELPDQKAYLGFFRHYNPFASYCGICVAAISGGLLVKWRNKALQAGVVLICLPLMALTFAAAFQSGSRLGTAVTVLTGFMVLLMGVAGRFLFRFGQLRSKGALVAVALLALVGAFGAVTAFQKTFNLVSAQEWRVGSGDLEEDMMHGMRVPAMTMGVSLWLEQPVVGSGPRAYWAHAPRLRGSTDKQVLRFSDPEMVHNDYIQTLAEYGLIGLSLILATLVVIVFGLWRLAYRQRFINENWIVPPIIAVSATVGIMVHAVADFTIHIVPVFCQLCVVLGAAYAVIAKNHVNTNPLNGGVSRGLRISTVLFGGGVLLWIGRAQITHAVDLVNYDYAKWHTSGDSLLSAKRRASKVAPDPFMLEDLGIDLFKKAVVLSDGEEHQDLLQEAKATLSEAYQMHPYRLPVVLNLASVHIELDNLPEADRCITEAFGLANNRWRKYRLDEVAINYLMARGEVLWKEERKASVAMAYFIEAEKYLESGDVAKLRKKRKLKKFYKNKLEEWLTVMERGKIEPASNLVFFDSKGL